MAVVSWSKAKSRVASTLSKLTKKVIKAVRKHIKAAKEECEILKTVRRKIPDGPFVRYIDSFHFGENFVMMFEPLGKNLYRLLEINEFKGFPLSLVRKWGQMILKGLRDLHDVGMIHTDMKVEII